MKDQGQEDMGLIYSCFSACCHFFFPFLLLHQPKFFVTLHIYAFLLVAISSSFFFLFTSQSILLSCILYVPTMSFWEIWSTFLGLLFSVCPPLRRLVDIKFGGSPSPIEGTLPVDLGNKVKAIKDLPTTVNQNTFRGVEWLGSSADRQLEVLQELQQKPELGMVSCSHHMELQTWKPSLLIILLGLSYRRVHPATIRSPTNQWP